MLTKQDFKVQIINADEVKNIFKSWGVSACTCYKTPEKFAEKVGKSCLQTGHFSGSRGDYIKFKITGVPRALVDQLVRHEVGVYKNVQSQRYTDSSNMQIYYPDDITSNDELQKLWDELTLEVKRVYDITVNTLLEKGYTNEQAREVARGIIPMNVESSLVIGFTIEALINLMEKRLCTCSQEHIRHLANLMRKEVVKLIPDLAPKLVPACVSKMYCPESEKRSCGIRPQKNIVESIVLDYMKTQKDKSV